MKRHCIYPILFIIYVPGRSNLRSTKSNLLILKRTDTKTTCKNYGWRDLRVFAPFSWGNLPVFIRQTESIDNFKNRLKTHHFVNIIGRRLLFLLSSIILI